MDKYVLINGDDNIIDVFFSYQKSKMKNPNKILIESNVDEIKHKINGKSISNDFGVPIFHLNTSGGGITERPESETDNDQNFIAWYKQKIKSDLKDYIRDNSYEDDITKTVEQIRNQWGNFKSSVESMTTKIEIDNAYQTAVDWLTS